MNLLQGIKSEEAIPKKVLRVEITIVPCCRLFQSAFRTAKWRAMITLTSGGPYSICSRTCKFSSRELSEGTWPIQFSLSKTAHLYSLFPLHLLQEIVAGVIAENA